MTSVKAWSSQQNFCGADFCGELVTFSTEAGCVMLDRGEDLRWKIAVVSRSEGATAEPARDCTDMALAAQANGTVGLIAINDGEYIGSGALLLLMARRG